MALVCGAAFGKNKFFFKLSYEIINLILKLESLLSGIIDIRWKAFLLPYIRSECCIEVLFYA